MQAIYLLSALLNGFFMATNRVLVSKISETEGAFISSIWNHFIGFITLAFLYMVTQPSGILETIGTIPYHYYLGGVIGGCYVALSSYLVNNSDIKLATSLIISGQIITGLLFDFLLGKGVSLPWAILGILLIFSGIYFLKLKKNN